MARKKKVVRKKSKSVSSGGRSLQQRIGIAWKNLVLFVILFLASYVLYTFSETVLFSTFFGIMSMIFGFVSVSFLIAFIVLISSRNKR